MDHKTILVTGSNGQVGRELQDIAPSYPKYKFIFSDRFSLDITQENSILKIVSFHPDYIINCAAYTAVDKAEIEQELAYLANVTACFHLVEAAKKCRASIIHFSSDYVYHINKKGPLLEIDPVDPKGIYAKSKLEGENVIRQYNKHVILRTSWVYSKYGNNFVNTMLRLAENKNELTIVADQIGSPTYAKDLVVVTMKIVEHLSSVEDPINAFGTYNFSNEGTISWYDFAKAIFKLKGIPMKLNSTTTKEYNAKAARPQWSLLSKNKIKKTFGVDVPHWYKSLKSCLLD